VGRRPAKAFSHYRQNLVTILEKDKNKQFDNLGSYKLQDKLMWGSDVPRIIADDMFRKDFDPESEFGYKHYLRHFKKTIRSAAGLSTNYQNGLIKKITSINPKKFLNITGGD
jgi:hypothetical protein